MISNYITLIKSVSKMEVAIYKWCYIFSRIYYTIYDGHGHYYIA